MMLTILEETFKNGDKLQLLFTQELYKASNASTQLNLTPSVLVNHYTLQYCENTIAGLQVTQREFFHLAEYKQALSAFNIRKNSKQPCNALNLGRSIEGIVAVGLEGPSIQSFKVYNDERASSAD